MSINEALRKQKIWEKILKPNSGKILGIERCEVRKSGRKKSKVDYRTSSSESEDADEEGAMLLFRLAEGRD